MPGCRSTDAVNGKGCASMTARMWNCLGGDRLYGGHCAGISVPSAEHPNRIVSQGLAGHLSGMLQLLPALSRELD